MQDALRILSDYWASQGCLTVQPFNTEVGAGTMNPATVMRVLGPEPWNVAYVEPSVRPDDSRYGQNPNRLQTHTQFQVILKPEPGNPQELYLGSLEALGIDLRAHDVRFVEDNWQQPAIGAWGLGWEVWLDGMEITQFTYFQQVGGQNLNPVPVELTYGMERIMMAIQKVTHFKDIQYAPGISYGEAFGQTEYEMSRYYLDEADVEANWRLYETYVAEAQRLVDAGLPVPAHTYVLKSSHAFNVLDARGSISTTQRAKAFATIRTLARQTSALWIERREELGLPLLKDDPQAPRSSYSEATLDVLSGAAQIADTGELTYPAQTPAPTQPQTFVLEVGVEELPPHVLDPTIEQIRTAVTSGLASSTLEHGQVWVEGTPRRVIVQVSDVAAREADSVLLRKGPKWQAAFDADGNPTKALEGFARGAGVEVSAVEAADFNGQEHAAIKVEQPGRDALTVLSAIITDAVDALRADKNMRWRDQELSFSRAVRWLLALWGPVAVPVQVSGLVAGRTTYVHRTDDQPFVAIAHADDLLPTLAQRNIITERQVRRGVVVKQAHELAGQVGGHVAIEDLGDLIDEITNLVESPYGILGNFDARYLELPEQILTAVMAKHQRYLPVRGATGELLPHFITMANGVCDDDVVRAGNESVLRARYEDALFFWEADLEAGTAESFIPNLHKLSFADGLGSVFDRARRIEDVANVLGQQVSLTDDQRSELARAGQLVKFDLGSQLVTEMSSLAGFVGKEYAHRMGESAGVAAAIEEAELPHTAAGELPQSAIGALLAVADRADLLVGLLATGAKASGSSDQFGLRRAALGLMRILREYGASSLAGLDLPTVLAAAADRLIAQGVEVTAEHVNSAADFARSRYEQLLRDEGMSADLVSALSHTTTEPAKTSDYASQIAALADPQHADHQAFAGVIAAVVRILRIIPADAPAQYDTALLTSAAESALVAELEKAPAFGSNWQEFALSWQPLAAAVQTFFEDTLVMAEDLAVRQARIGLLASIIALTPSDIDWVKLDQVLDQA